MADKHARAETVATGQMERNMEGWMEGDRGYLPNTARSRDFLCKAISIQVLYATLSMSQGCHSVWTDTELKNVSESDDGERHRGQGMLVYLLGFYGLATYIDIY